MKDEFLGMTIAQALDECMRQRDLFRRALEEIGSSTASHPLTKHPRRIGRLALDEGARQPQGDAPTRSVR